MAGLYGPRSVDLPNTNALTNFYKNSAQINWVETRKSNTLTSLNLAEEMKKLIELAEKRSYYFPEFLSDSVIGKGVLSKESTALTSSDKKDVKASLEFELEHINTRLAEVQLAKINHLIGMSLLQDRVEESDSKKTGEKTSPPSDETTRDTKMREASLSSLKSNLSLQEMVLEEFQGLQNVLEEQALSCELLLLDEKDAQQFKEKWGALEKLQKTNETVQVNPQLSALREKVLQQKYTHQSIFESLDAQRQARAILEGKLETTLKKGPST
ncbi:MAG: hypothetical protein K2X66_06840, partial [Cyanobacteria bacterium]|nr:hypothetical protein [Cyanobacteriota bacterium]